MPSRILESHASASNTSDSHTPTGNAPSHDNKPIQRQFKKMAGTSAVFVDNDYPFASPVERDGMVWAAAELGISGQAQTLFWKEPLPNTLALEGLEDYDPPQQGDARYVNSQAVAFYFLADKRIWVQLTDCI